MTCMSKTQLVTSTLRATVTKTKLRHTLATALYLQITLASCEPSFTTQQLDTATLFSDLSVSAYAKQSNSTHTHTCTHGHTARACAVAAVSTDSQAQCSGTSPASSPAGIGTEPGMQTCMHSLAPKAAASNTQTTTLTHRWSVHSNTPAVSCTEAPARTAGHSSATRGPRLTAQATRHGPYSTTPYFTTLLTYTAY